MVTSETINSFLRTKWRIVGYWGLTLNVVLLPVSLVVVPAYFPAASLNLISGHFPMMLSAWVAAAAVRQWGKSKGEK